METFLYFKRGTTGLFNAKALDTTQRNRLEETLHKSQGNTHVGRGNKGKP